MSHGRGVGVLVEDREVLGLHPELVGDERRHRHHGAGAVLLRAGDDRAGAVRVQLHVRAGVGREARPPAAGDADRLVVGQLLPVADQLDRASRASPSSRSARAPDRSGVTEPSSISVRRRSSTGSMPSAVGELVHVLLERPADLRRRRGADRRRGLVVRVDERRLDVHVLDLVRAERVHRRHLREEAALAAVGALVEHEPRRGARRACRPCARPSRARSPSPRAGGRRRRTPRGARRRASRGAPAARASAATWPSKWKSHLAPKPPPSSGTITRTCDSGICSVVGDAGRARRTAPGSMTRR